MGASTATTVGAGALSEAKGHFDELGYVVLRRYDSDDELAPAQAALPKLFPTVEEFHSDTSPDRDERFLREHRFGLQAFPYKAVEWSVLNVAPPLVHLAEALLGSTDICLNEAHNWAKFSGVADYDQQLHRDYGNHTVLAPTLDPSFGEVEMFIWIHEVPIDHGPTRVVSRRLTQHVPGAQREIRREEAPEIYDAEVAADGPAGTVLAYRNDTFHRGAAITAERAARYALKASFKVNNPFWTDSLGANGKCMTPEWAAFVEHASPRMLEMIGYPPPGHPYWTAHTWDGIRLRYPNADLTAFAPAGTDT
jgi:hypothetical protein